MAGLELCVLTQSGEDIFNALERIALGLEKKDAVMSEQKKKLVAYHEAGQSAETCDSKRFCSVLCWRGYGTQQNDYVNYVYSKLLSDPIVVSIDGYALIFKDHEKLYNQI